MSSEVPVPFSFDVFLCATGNLTQLHVSSNIFLIFNKVLTALRDDSS